MTADALSSTAETAGGDFTELARRIRAARLLRLRPGYYTAKITITLLLFAAGWAAFVIIGASWWNLLTAVFLALMSTQIGFLGHDVGHKQVFRTKTNSTRLSLVLGNLLLGLSIAWWVDKHNRHHANPNHEDKDPDVGDGAIAFTVEQAAKRSSTLGRWLARNQGWMFFVLMPLESLSLHLSSVRFVRQGSFKTRPMRIWEAITLLAHMVLYPAAVFAVLTPAQAVAFIVVHQGLWGSYMALSFAPNHKGMPILTAADQLDFLRKQVLTSRNIRGRFAGWALGGLNYQIEHHLFPNMPRPALRHARPIVRAYCAEIGVPYAETSFWGSYGQVVAHLNAVGAAA